MNKLEKLAKIFEILSKYWEYRNKGYELTLSSSNAYCLYVAINPNFVSDIDRKELAILGCSPPPYSTHVFKIYT